MLPKFAIAFFPRSKCLNFWLQSLPTMILEAKKRKSVIVSTLASCICHEVMGLDIAILVVVFNVEF